MCSAPLPAEPAAGEVLVRVDLATVCGSDLHTVAGHRSSPAPGVLGHEQVGTVVAAGDGASVRAGERIAWSVTASCGRCARCRRGIPQKCFELRKYGHEPLDEKRPLTGGFASHCLLWPGTTVVKVPDDVPDEVAAPAGCATATVAAAVRAGGSVGAGDRVLVTGAGMLGLTATAMLARRGAHVITADPDPARREQARQFGAAEIADGTEEIDGIDLAVELSGATTAVRTALDSLTIGGTLVLAGTVSPGPAVPLDPERTVRRLLTVTGVHNYTPADLRTAVDFLAGSHHTYPFATLVSAPYPLHRLDEAFTNAGSAARHSIAPARSGNGRAERA
ncbi:zinc-binding dehydrogenase [Actinoplanes sp. NPDC000266]